eukprot:3554903-Heterocapsa_arctica.AAC.1
MIALMARRPYAISSTNSQRVRGGQHLGAAVALELKSPGTGPTRSCRRSCTRRSPSWPGGRSRSPRQTRR